MADERKGGNGRRGQWREGSSRADVETRCAERPGQLAASTSTGGGFVMSPRSHDHVMRATAPCMASSWARVSWSGSVPDRGSRSTAASLLKLDIKPNSGAHSQQIDIEIASPAEIGGRGITAQNQKPFRLWQWR